MNRNNEVCAVVVTYNRLQLLQKCLDALRVQTYPCDVLVIDNNSTDNTKQFMSAYASNNPNIIYFRTQENLGGAGGFNLGARKAVESGYKYLWMMDDDCICEKNALEKLIGFDTELAGQYGFLSSKVLWTDGELCNMNKQYVSIYRKVNGIDRYNLQKIIMASFCGFFIKSEMIKKYGLPIKDFVIWADDLEYSRRITLSGESSFFVPESVLTHHISSNNKVGIENDSEDRMWRYKKLYRNEFYLYKREGFIGLIIFFARVLIHVLRIIVSSSDNKIRKIRIILKSVKNGFGFEPIIEKI